MASIEAEILALDQIEFWLLTIVVSALSLWALRKMALTYWAARTIENVPTAKIRSAAQGYVELIGDTEMMEGPVIVSPLSGKTCVWFRYIIEERRTVHTKKGSRTRWVKIKEQVSDEVFLLKDATGQCVIDPEGADVITDNKHRWNSTSIFPKRRYTEWLINQNEHLYAIGLFKSITHIEQQKIREQVSDLLRQWKKDDPNKLVHLYDTNGDGEVDMHEWQHVRAAAEQQVKQQSHDFGSLNVLATSPHSDQQFILSTLPESHLINRYKQRALLALLGFMAGGSLVVWAVNVRLGIN